MTPRQVAKDAEGRKLRARTAMNTPLSRLIHALLGAALFLMPLLSLACGGPDFTTALTPDSGGAHGDAGADADYRPIIVYFEDGGSEATSPEAALRDTRDESVDATLDGPSPHDGSLDTSKDAPAPEGGACSGLQCDGGCVPNDPRNCGTCGHDCTALPYVAAAGLSCVAGKCIYQCAPGFADCGDAGAGCGVSLSQNGNCGACGVTCTGPTPVCSGSGCTSNCSGSAPTLCGSSCANTQSDSQNCGTCGHACMTMVVHATATCAGGACTTQCDTSLGYSPCGGACVDMSKDNNNCGACGTQCASGTTCSAGRCVCNASSGCAGCCSGGTTCVAPSPATGCGTGGSACTACTVSGQTCVSGGCACPTGQMVCGSACVDTSKDNLNCGACGTQCALGTTCSAGRCVCNASSGCAGCCSGGTTCVAPSPATGCGTGGSACTACTVSGQTCVSGGCACPGGQTACGSACVNTSGDANNCGRCGHTCQGGACTNGMCQPVVLAPGNPGSMTVDGTNVYWLDGVAGVMKCGINGCGNVPLKIASLFTNTTPAPEQIAVDALNVYWIGGNSAGGSQDIMHCGISGCGTPTALSVGGFPTEFALDLVNAYVYWIDPSGPGVLQVSVNGGTPIQFAGGSGFSANGITMSGGIVYWTTTAPGPGSGDIFSCPTTGCLNQGTLIASGSNGPWVIVANGTGVFWGQLGGAPNQRLTPPTASGTVSTLAGSGKDLAVDGTNLYWTDGSLQTCPGNACTNIANVTTLYTSSGGTSTGPIAIDATSIYWGDSAKGVMKLAKP